MNKQDIVALNDRNRELEVNAMFSFIEETHGDGGETRTPLENVRILYDAGFRFINDSYAKGHIQISIDFAERLRKNYESYQLWMAGTTNGPSESVQADIEMITKAIDSGEPMENDPNKLLLADLGMFLGFVEEVAPHGSPLMKKAKFMRKRYIPENGK